MTLDDIARRKINLDSIAPISRTRRTTTRFFCAGWGGPTSVEIGARISEISHILGLSGRWLRESLQRDIVAVDEWAASGGW